eukprot:1157446-Pelagomonas_calceolata.AAC.10
MEKQYVGHCLLRCGLAILTSRATHTTAPDKRRSRWVGVAKHHELPIDLPLHAFVPDARLASAPDVNFPTKTLATLTAVPVRAGGGASCCPLA